MQKEIKKRIKNLWYIYKSKKKMKYLIQSNKVEEKKNSGIKKREESS